MKVIQHIVNLISYCKVSSLYIPDLTQCHTSLARGVRAYDNTEDAYKLIDEKIYYCLILKLHLSSFLVSNT